MGLADLHIHTIYSYDASASVSAVLERAQRVGLDVIAVTDHDEILGSLRARDQAHRYGLEAIPGIEITTAEGDLLAYQVTRKIPHGRPLIDTILEVGQLGGFCIAPHPMAGGLGMKSLSATSIVVAIRQPEVPGILLGLETYNATALDRKSNRHARILAEHYDLAQTGNSDAHVAGAVGLGATKFTGHAANDLLTALRARQTEVFKQKEWTAFRVLGSWAASYVASTFTRIANTG